jgi:Predicted periplasmic protein (DUF2271)
MKTLLSALALTTALAIPAAVAAKPVTFSATMKNYRGPGAYLVMYVTDSKGVYQGSLWMAGGKSKYYKHLPGWFRATRGDLAQVSGITGASVGAGRQLEISLDLSDALFDAGYQLHIDASVEDGRDVANEVVVPLTSANMGKAARGKRYVASLTFK